MKQPPSKPTTQLAIQRRKLSLSACLRSDAGVIFCSMFLPPHTPAAAKNARGQNDGKIIIFAGLEDAPLSVDTKSSRGQNIANVNASPKIIYPWQALQFSPILLNLQPNLVLNSYITPRILLSMTIASAPYNS